MTNDDRIPEEIDELDGWALDQAFAEMLAEVVQLTGRKFPPGLNVNVVGEMIEVLSRGEVIGKISRPAMLERAGEFRARAGRWPLVEQVADLLVANGLVRLAQTPLPSGNRKVDAFFEDHLPQWGEVSKAIDDLVEGLTTEEAHVVFKEAGDVAFWRMLAIQDQAAQAAKTGKKLH